MGCLALLTMCSCVQISLADQLQLDPDNPDTVTKFLEQYVEEVLRQAATQLQDHPDRPKLPLV